MTAPRRIPPFNTVIQQWCAKQARRLGRLTRSSAAKGLAYGAFSTLGATGTSYALWWIHSR